MAPLERLSRALLVAVLGLASALGPVACDEGDRVPARAPRCPPPPPPPEPPYQAVVVGTIGKMHMAESQYPLSKLGDVLATFKPDLVLVGVRVDAYREGHLEDASFEMTYVNHLARMRTISVEPIDWFREQDFGAPAAAADPWDEVEIAKKEAEVLGLPQLYTFEKANGADLEQKVLLATAAEARHRSGNPVASRRAAWMQQLAASAVSRHDRPKRVLAFVDVLDRPNVDMALHAIGYTMNEPVALVAKSKNEIIADLPADVLNDWRAQLDRAHAKGESAKSAPEKAFWMDRERALSVVVDRKAACCVPQASLTAER